MSAGWWVYSWGGLFDGRAAEKPPLLHAVNLDECVDGATLCGKPRFRGDGVPGGAWRPEATSYVESGSAQVGSGSDGVQVCPRCADALVRIAARQTAPT